jgi:hypothetical protein
MGYGPIQVFTATMAAASDSCVVSLPKGYTQIHYVLPSLSTNAELALQASYDGETYKVVRHASMVAAPTAKVFASSVANSIIPGSEVFPYIKLVASAAPTSAAIFKFICVY